MKGLLRLRNRQIEPQPSKAGIDSLVETPQPKSTNPSLKGSSKAGIDSLVDCLTNSHFDQCQPWLSSSEPLLGLTKGVFL